MSNHSRYAAVPLVLLFLLLPVRGDAQERERRGGSSVRGHVLSEETGRPIPDVEITLEGDSVRVFTDGEGAFRFAGVPAGDHVLRARHLGYEDRSASLTVPFASIVEITLTLTTEPIELGEIEVVVRSPLLARAGFYERQKQGYAGEFLDRADIERKNPESVTALFRNMRGLRVIYAGIDGARVYVNQRVSFRDSNNRLGCQPTLWIDGVRSTMRSYDMMRVEELEGIEVYTGAGAPGTYNDICGTVLIWTRVPIRERGEAPGPGVS